ncbi:MAG: ATP-binding protein [Desulforhopalus sp.]|nr:ATP-binding protein [Desulforhopalus sp.]
MKETSPNPQLPVFPPKKEPEESELGSFKLVKYFSFTSLGVILACAVLLSWLISDNARTVMLQQNEENSRLLAENINQQVFRRFVLPALIRFGDISLRNPEQAEMLDSVIQSTIQGLKIESVSIYDSGMNIISYSTEKVRVGKKDAGGEEYYSALSGEPASTLIYTGSILSLLHITGEVSCVLNTFIPFHQLVRDGVEGTNIMGVIEIQKDLTSSYAHIIRFQGRIISVSLFLMGGLFLVLRSIVSRAGDKLEKRAEERQKLKEKLDQAERLAHLGTMIAIVSHELKSPLGIVHSTAEILEKRMKKIAPGSEDLAAIVVKETERLNNIVLEFLDFARPQDMRIENGDLNITLRKVLEFLQPELKKKGISLITNLDPALPLLRFDTDMMYRAVLNIMVNAVQSMPGRGDLMVTTWREGDKVELSVADTGEGMSEEVRNKIFQPFYTKKRKGTGLGLAIVGGILERHGAEFRVESTEGKGTTFVISLPINLALVESSIA